MSEQEQKPAETYLTYRGLGFTSMVAGIPLFAALGLMGGLVLVMILLAIDAVILALVVAVICIGIFLFLRNICENNNKAPLLFKLGISGLLSRVIYGKIIYVDVGVENEQRKKFRQQFKSLFESE